jgi:hypothetical protein
LHDARRSSLRRDAAERARVQVRFAFLSTCR